MFNTDRFVSDCIDAIAEDESHKAVREILDRAVSVPASVLEGLGEPTVDGVQKLHVSDTLTILNVVWPAWMSIRPHNHEMWAVIGIYSGREDNTFWRRIPNADGGKIQAAGANAMCVKDTAPLGADIIHSVNNPIPRLTGAIHVYGGNFFEEPRLEWDAETLLEGPYDVAKNMRAFDEFGAR